MAQQFSKTSEWVAAGNMASGYYLLEQVARATDKAIGFAAQKCNEFGNLKPAICWIPKSQVQEVENDFYTQGPAKCFLVPGWLYSKKANEGYVL